MIRTTAVVERVRGGGRHGQGRLRVWRDDQQLRRSGAAIEARQCGREELRDHCPVVRQAVDDRLAANHAGLAGLAIGLHIGLVARLIHISIPHGSSFSMAQRVGRRR